jgi:hypothetical protein
MMRAIDMPPGRAEATVERMIVDKTCDGVEGGKRVKERKGKERKEME